MKKLKTKTLWAITIVSGFCFAFSFVIATPIGMLADKILLARFSEQWPQTHTADPFWYMALGEQIFTFTTLAIALAALVFGILAAKALYQRKHSV